MVRPLASGVRSFSPCNFHLCGDFQLNTTPVLTALRLISVDDSTLPRRPQQESLHLWLTASWSGDLWQKNAIQTKEACPSGARDSQLYFGYVTITKKKQNKDPLGHHHHYRGAFYNNKDIYRIVNQKQPTPYLIEGKHVIDGILVCVSSPNRIDTQNCSAVTGVTQRVLEQPPLTKAA